jgi:hypothetical protein
MHAALFVFLGGLLAALAVGLGALGAHALKTQMFVFSDLPPHAVLMIRIGPSVAFFMVMPKVNSGPILPPSSAGLLRLTYVAFPAARGVVACRHEFQIAGISTDPTLRAVDSAGRGPGTACYACPFASSGVRIYRFRRPYHANDSRPRAQITRVEGSGTGAGSVMSSV